jgi:hypothetical protein
LAYADDDNIYILNGSVCTVKKNIEALLVTSKATELEVNADKTKYMVISQGQIARQSHSIKTDNGSFERVEELRYLGTTVMIKILFRKKLRADCVVQFAV